MKRYGSDVMVDAIKACGFRYVSLNPGSSYRGLHDSLVNYGGNDPEIITCNHEKLAVGIAHGYAKAAREPMACILHDIVGLLHGSMGIYYAWIDRAPVVVFGGAGPMAYDRRRPHIDWIHTALVQGNAVRDFTKWDDQPASVASVPESVMRGYRIATAAPQGPVYIALDAGLQEDELVGEVPLPNWDRLRTPSPIGPDPAALRAARRAAVRRRAPAPRRLLRRPRPRRVRAARRARRAARSGRRRHGLEAQLPEPAPLRRHDGPDPRVGLRPLRRREGHGQVDAEARPDHAPDRVADPARVRPCSTSASTSSASAPGRTITPSCTRRISR